MRVTNCPQDPGLHPQGPLTPTAIVWHRTYGKWPGDYAVGKNGRDGVGIGFHFLIGKASMRWNQFYDTMIEAAHALGANNWAIGIELEGTNDEPLTDWQVAALRWITQMVCDAHKIPRTYTNTGARRKINGILPHLLVPGSTHTDTISWADWQRVFPDEPVIPAGPAQRPGYVPLSRPALSISDTVQPLVRVLQAELNFVAGAGLPIDGVYGMKTAQKVSDFQKFVGAPVDPKVFSVADWFILDAAFWNLGTDPLKTA